MVGQPQSVLLRRPNPQLARPQPLMLAMVRHWCRRWRCPPMQRLPRHQLPRRSRIQELQIGQGLLQVRIEALHVLGCGKGSIPLLVLSLGQFGLHQQHAQFITDDLHGHGEIQ